MVSDVTPEPKSVSRTWDREARKLHRGRWFLVVGMGIIVLAAIGILGYLVSKDTTRLSASCSFYKDIGSAVLAPAPGTTHPTRLGVSIVIDSRTAYVNEGCPAGHLPPPSPSLIRWARYYHMPVP